MASYNCAVRNLGAHNRRLVLVLCLGLACAACTYQHSRQRTVQLLENVRLVTHHHVSRSSDWVLASSTPVCFSRSALPQLNPLLDTALRQRFITVHALPTMDTAAQHLHAARRAGCQALLVPQVPPLERRRELVAGRFGIELALYEVASGRLLETSRTEAAAGAVTPTAALPEALLRRAVEAYVSRISNGALKS